MDDETTELQTNEVDTSDISTTEIDSDEYLEFETVTETMEVLESYQVESILKSLDRVNSNITSNSNCVLLGVGVALCVGFFNSMKK